MKKEIVDGVINDLSSGCQPFEEIVRRYVYPAATSEIAKIPDERINLLARKIVLAVGGLAETRIPFYTMMRDGYWESDEGKRVRGRLEDYLMKKKTAGN